MRTRPVRAGSPLAPWISTASNPAALARRAALAHASAEAGELGLIKGDGVVGLKHARNDAHDPAGHVGIFGMRAAPAVLELDGDGGPVGVDAFRRAGAGRG